MRSLLLGKDECTVELGHEERVALLERYRHRLSDLEFGLRNLKTRLQPVVETRAVRQQFVLMRPGDYRQTSVLYVSIHQREPYRQHQSLVGVWIDHALVLVPRCNTELHVTFLVARCAVLRHLDAHVLHRVGVDFGSDERFDGVQKAGCGECVEHRGDQPRTVFPR